MPTLSPVSFIDRYTPRAIFVLLFLALCTIAFFSTYYITHDYSSLIARYMQVNDCFYRREFWTRDFFTLATKKDGNKLAVAGLLVSLAALVYLLLNGKRYWSMTLQSRPKDWKWYGGIALFAIAVWAFGYHMLAPSYDEIFSGVNCSELPIPQLLSYYMLPNHHVFFNFLNHVFGGWYGQPVATGRVVSLCAFIGVLCVSFSFLAGLFKNKVVAAVALLPIALQFTAWGFATQARGYESLLFCGWMSFVSIIRYQQTEDVKDLRMNAIFSTMGFAFVPVYLYYYLPQLLFCAIMMGHKRRIDARVFKYAFFCFSLVFLFYLPIVSFSGLGAMNGNPYVRSMAPDMRAFMLDFFDMFVDFTNFVFFDFFGHNNPVNFILLLLPLLLFFSAKKERRWIALFHLLLWLGFITINGFMRTTSPQRSCIIIFSLSITFAVYTIFVLLEWLFASVRVLPLKVGVWIASLLVSLIAVHEWRAFTHHAGFRLYSNGINELWQMNNLAIDQIPAGSTVAFSEESFYLYFLCRQKHYKVNRCRVGNEAYFIKRTFEPLPDDSYKTNYVLFGKGEDACEIYKHL